MDSEATKELVVGSNELAKRMLADPLLPPSLRKAIEQTLQKGETYLLRQES